MSAQIPNNYKCDFCGDTFSSKSDRRKHRNATHPRCAGCCKRFKEPGDAQIHQRKTGHCCCRDCNLYFANTDEHILHLRKVAHSPQYSCCDCGRDYPDSECLKRHCCHCDRVYKSRKRLQGHFKSHPQHRLRPKVARVEPEINLRHKCNKCEKRFATKKALKEHKRTHKPPRIIPCSVGGACSKKFATPSALLNHLESGRCHSGMTRGRLNELVLCHDKEGYIVDHTAVKAGASAGKLSSLMLKETLKSPSRAEVDDDSDSDWSSDSPKILTPATSETSSEWNLAHKDEESMDVRISDHKSDSTIVYKGRTCPLCPTRKPFRSAAAFEAHMHSPAHAPRMFHCPTAFIRDVLQEGAPVRMRSFSTLSGLAQHLEKGVCAGGLAALGRAIEYVEKRLQLHGLGYIKFRLD